MCKLYLVQRQLDEQQQHMPQSAICIKDEQYSEQESDLVLGGQQALTGMCSWNKGSFVVLLWQQSGVM